MRIFLVRHGQSEWNGKKRISGQLDPPLSQKGLQYSLNLEIVLRKEKLTAIYTSTLKRAIDTSRPTAVYHHLAIQSKDALKEIHFGILQGRFRDDRDPEAQEMWEERKKDKQRYKIPGAETFLDLEKRVVSCLNNIIKKEAKGVILIVGHRSTNRVILGKLMHWPVDLSLMLNPRSKYLYEITPGNKPEINTISLDEKKCGIKYEGFRM